MMAPTLEFPLTKGFSGWSKFGMLYGWQGIALQRPTWYNVEAHLKIYSSHTNREAAACQNSKSSLPFNQLATNQKPSISLWKEFGEIISTRPFWASQEAAKPIP